LPERKGGGTLSRSGKGAVAIEKRTSDWGDSDGTPLSKTKRNPPSTLQKRYMKEGGRVFGERRKW